MPRAAGYMSIVDPESPIVEADTLQCVHCGRHWKMKPGSGNVRGFCFNCNGPVCGPKCAECVPASQMYDNLAAGRPANHRPVTGPVKIWLPGVD